MKERLTAECLPTLIGSLPLRDHGEALGLVWQYTPEIPIWVQLPYYSEEGMIAQFASGMPQLCADPKRIFIDTESDAIDDASLHFYEEYMAVIDGQTRLEDSRFILDPACAQGFYRLQEHLAKQGPPQKAVKGQITGPMTFATGLSDAGRRAIFYNPQLRDIAVKLLALKARWQVEQLSRCRRPVIIFLDEPALAGFGSSAFIGVSHAEILACINEIVESIHAAGGLAGIHVCANTDWAMIMDANVDIVNFDAYGFFDRFILYSDQIVDFFKSGRILAWGIVPTSDSADIDRESAASLVSAWNEKAAAIEALGIDRTVIERQSLITPSCGAGSLSSAHALKVLTLTRQVSDALRG